MQITPENVGDIIQMKSRCIQIESVDDSFVLYRRETGNHYATSEHEIEGFVVQDKERIHEFETNATLGESLDNAHYRAICTLLDGASTNEQREDANLVLSSTLNMKNRLQDRINQRTTREAEGPHRPLDSIISCASEESQSRQSPSDTAVKQGPDR